MDPATPPIPATPPCSPIKPAESPIKRVCAHNANAFGDACLACGDRSWWHAAGITYLQCRACYTTLSDINCAHCFAERGVLEPLQWRQRAAPLSLTYEKELEEGELPPGLQRISTLLCGCTIWQKYIHPTSEDPYWSRPLMICARHIEDGVTTLSPVPDRPCMCDGCNKYNEFWEPLEVMCAPRGAKRHLQLCYACMKRLARTCEQCLVLRHQDDMSVQELVGTYKALPRMALVCYICYDTLKQMKIICTPQ
jgi:hypothetical protein